MQVRSIRMKLIAAVGALMMCLGLTSSALALSCSNETFRGSYGFTVTGFITPGANGTNIPIGGVQLITADGKGNMTDTESILIAGTPLPGGNAPGFFSLNHGTYSINSDCTGTGFLTDGVRFISLSIIVDEKGRQVRMVGVPPFDTDGLLRVVVSVGEKVNAP